MALKVGFVLGNKPANPLEFWVGIERGNIVQLDDLLKVETLLENGQKVYFYGVVTEIYRYLEGSEFVFDSKDFVMGKLPAHLAYVAKVQVSRIEEEIYVPPFPGDSVYLLKEEDKEDIEKALYFDQMEVKIPAGLLRNSLPVFINYHFLNGKDGAHVSISGISGVASKTSYALFLLNSLFQKSNERIHAIIFNVKGEDLFFIDKPNRLFKEREKEIKPLYEKLGLEAKPFEGVKFFAPPKKRGSLIPDVETRLEGVSTFVWTVKEFAKEGLIKFMFPEGEEGIGGLHYIIDKVAERLKELAEENEELARENNNPTWKDRLFNTDLYNEEGLPLPPKEIESLEDLLSFLKKLVKDRRKCNNERNFRREREDFCNKTAQVYEKWFGSVNVSAAYAFLRRFEHAVSYVSPMVVSADLFSENGRDSYRIDWRKAPLSVIGINRLHNIAQMFVVGAILKKLFAEKEKVGRKPVLYLVLDELNKYAPREGWSPIKDILLDIAERGRSLGIILIGAQQTASEVEKRIVANASVKVNGRMDAAEVYAKEYDYLPPVYKHRSLLLKKGQLILNQPDIPLPLIVSFPFPAWATRREEVYREITDEDLKDFDNFIGD